MEICFNLLWVLLSALACIILNSIHFKIRVIFNLIKLCTYIFSLQRMLPRNFLLGKFYFIFS